MTNYFQIALPIVDSKYFITERLHKRMKTLKMSTICDSYVITSLAGIFDLTNILIPHHFL